jgi:hypothetical protein
MKGKTPEPLELTVATDSNSSGAVLILDETGSEAALAQMR